MTWLNSSLRVFSIINVVSQHHACSDDVQIVESFCSSFTWLHLATPVADLSDHYSNEKVQSRFHLAGHTLLSQVDLHV